VCIAFGIAKHFLDEEFRDRFGTVRQDVEQLFELIVLDDFK